MMRTKMTSFFYHFLNVAASANRLGLNLMRIAILIIFVWIGGLKYFAYEADGIVPFVANSPFMSFFYKFDAPEYKQHMNAEGVYKADNREWHKQNNTYVFSYGLGALIVTIGILVFLGMFSPETGIIGAILAILMTLGTLSFLVTTPESWVPALGDSDFGFPFLSGRGRLVIKDVAILAGAVILLADSAKQKLAKAERLNKRKE